MKNTTLLIQGRINLECYNFYVNNYIDFPVVISTWSSAANDIKIEELPSNFYVLFSKKPSVNGKQNSNLQIESTKRGLKLVDTKYVIKMRGDEYYSNIKDLEALISSNENKIITSPVFFRSPTMCKYHVSDHLIIGTTENLKKMFYLEKYDPSTPIEVNLAKNFLSKVDEKYLDEPIDSMCRNFDIIDLTKHKPYKIVCNGRRKVWTNFIPEKNGSISKMINYKL